MSAKVSSPVPTGSRNSSLPPSPQNPQQSSNNITISPPSRPTLLLNGSSTRDVVESPINDESMAVRLSELPNSPTYSFSTFTRHTRSFSGGRSSIDLLDDPFAYSIQKTEKAIDRLQKIGAGVELVGNVLSTIPLLQSGGGIMMVLHQMLEAAKKMMENKLDALGLVSDSITIVEAVHRRIQASATSPSEDMRHGIDALFIKLTSNTELLEKFVNRSRFKLFLYAGKMQRQIESARNDTLMYIARFTLESVVSLDQLQQEAERQRQQDREEFVKRLNQFIRNPESARHLVANEEVPEILVTLQREVERQAHTRYHSPASSQLPKADVEFPIPRPYYPPILSSQHRTQGRPNIEVDCLSSISEGFYDEENGLALTRHPTWEETTPPPIAHTRRAWHVTSDDLDIETSKGEFCHTFLKYLRSESERSVEDLPVWTITEYEVYREERECTSNFAKVWRGKWHDQQVAIKDLDPLTDKYLFLAEVNIWCRLTSEFVLPFLGASSALGPPPWFLISPWMKNGRITDYIRTEAGRGVDRVSLIHRIAQGMEYLHSRDVVHGDLKGQNILIDEEGRPKLCDFGLSQIKIDITNKSSLPPPEGESAAGTLRFQAPERLQSCPLTKECDVYSFAMTIYQLYSGEIPFAALDTYNAKMAIIEGVRPPKLPDIQDQLYDLMTRCWQPDPAARPTFEVISAELKGMYDQPYSPPQSSRSIPTLLDISTDGIQYLRSPASLSVPFDGLVVGGRDPEIWLTAQSRSGLQTEEEDITLSGVLSADPVLSESEPDDVSLITETDTAVYLPDQTDHEAPTEVELERRYRRHFKYSDYSDRLNLPLWSPSDVALGDIGFMNEGRFIHLSNAIGITVIPAPASALAAISPNSVIPVSETAVYPRLVSDIAKDFGVRIVSAFRTKKKTVTKAVRRQISVPMYPGHKAVRLIVADGKMQMIKEYWIFRNYLRDNIESILDQASVDGHVDLRKEDIILVVGVLTANNYAMAVSDYAPGTTLKFNVVSPTRRFDKEPWGFWTIARDRSSDSSSSDSGSNLASSSNPSPPPSGLAGIPPSPPGLPVLERRLPGIDDQPLQYSVKTSRPDGPKNAVHLSVLRFPPTGGEPTFFCDLD